MVCFVSPEKENGTFVQQQAQKESLLSHKRDCLAMVLSWRELCRSRYCDKRKKVPETGHSQSYHHTVKSNENAPYFIAEHLLFKCIGCSLSTDWLHSGSPTASRRNLIMDGVTQYPEELLASLLGLVFLKLLRCPIQYRLPRSSCGCGALRAKPVEDRGRLVNVKVRNSSMHGGTCL